MASIGVALSGGGYRASLFGLGVLLYLVDSEKNRDVTSISSVSGGSITNGYVAQSTGYQATNSKEFWNNIRPLAQTIAQQTLWSTMVTWMYLTFLAVFLIGIFYVSFYVLPFAGLLRAVVFVLLLVLWGWVLQQRGVIAGRAFRNKLFSPKGTPTRLANIEKDINHVFCATHLNAGEHFYFSSSFVYSYRFGWGKPGNLPLYVAVQASAAFPGGFPPRWLSIRQFRFQDGSQSPLPRRVTLSDGGVYDNMADQWLVGIDERARKRPNLGLNVPDNLVIVNSSAGLAWSRVRGLRIPLLGEFLALLRVNSVMYDNSASLRMRSLYGSFTRNGGQSGVFVNIEQSPFKVPRDFDNGNSPEAVRARAAMEKLGDPKEWKKITEDNAEEPTTLSKLGTKVASRLIRHGYAVAMANCHTILDYPLLDLPENSTIEALTA